MIFRIHLAAALTGCLILPTAPALAQMAERPSDARCQAVGIVLNDHAGILKAEIAVSRAAMANPPSATDQAKLDAWQAELDAVDDLWGDLWMIYVDGSDAADEDEIDWADSRTDDELMETGRTCLK